MLKTADDLLDGLRALQATNHQEPRKVSCFLIARFLLALPRAKGEHQSVPLEGIYNVKYLHM